MALLQREERADALHHMRRAVELQPRYCQAQSALLSLELVEGDTERIATTRRNLAEYCP
ncbi:MAG: hypothetical protein AAGD38_12450 [Acidobacteriota bacterium]